METEAFYSGYCRNTDSSRMVAVITEDHRLTEVDCSYETCPHATECSIAAHIREQLQQ